VCATCLHFMTSELRPSGEFTCSQPILTEVVSVEVDHYTDPTVIMYSPDLMVPSLTRKGLNRSNDYREFGYSRISGIFPCLSYPSTFLDPMVGILSEVFLRSYGLCLLRDTLWFTMSFH
jgi:hypothetical protein